VRVYGSAGTQEHRLALEEAARRCKEKGLKRLLVDLRELDTENISTATTRYDFGKLLSEKALSVGLQIAHLMPKKEKSKNHVSFTVTVAENRGARLLINSKISMKR